jgi:hypothetical protein
MFKVVRGLSYCDSDYVYNSYSIPTSSVKTYIKIGDKLSMKKIVETAPARSNPQHNKVTKLLKQGVKPTCYRKISYSQCYSQGQDRNLEAFYPGTSNYFCIENLLIDKDKILQGSYTDTKLTMKKV